MDETVEIKRTADNDFAPGGWLCCPECESPLWEHELVDGECEICGADLNALINEPLVI
jgi:hypothetical protein